MMVRGPRRRFLCSVPPMSPNSSFDTATHPNSSKSALKVGFVPMIEWVVRNKRQEAVHVE